MQHAKPPFDLSHADGILDQQNPAEGKYSLRLDGKVELRNYWPTWRHMWTREYLEEREKAPIRSSIIRLDRRLA